MRYIYIFYFEIGCLSFIEYIFKHCVFSSEYVISCHKSYLAVLKFHKYT